MDYFSPKKIKDLLSQYGTGASKGFGQNFLINKGILDKILAEANLVKEDIILEVGPGMGVLTAQLAEKAKKVICIEKDRKMIEILKENTKQYNNIEIVVGDVLKTDLSNYLKDKSYKVVANIPYYITAPLIRFFLENKNQPRELILMVQKEVAQRICANPPKMSLLAVSVQYYAKPEILFYVSKNSFWPAPKVDSAVIKITPIKPPGDPKMFFRVAKAGFSHPRKQLAGNLSKSLKISKPEIEKLLLESGINPTQRAETLSIKDWIALGNTIK